MEDHKLYQIVLQVDDTYNGYIIKVNNGYYGILYDNDGGNEYNYLFGKLFEKQQIDLFIDGNRYATLKCEVVGHTINKENYQDYRKINKKENLIARALIVDKTYTDRNGLIANDIKGVFKSHLLEDKRFQDSYEMYFGSTAPVFRDILINSYKYRELK